jgi:hypothetical protein
MKPAPCTIILVLAATLAACTPAALATPTPDLATPTTNLAGPTPLPLRTPHPPGEIFEYAAQQGDTLPAVAAHFHTSEREILAANPDLPAGITTLPPGYPLRVPAYYRADQSPLHTCPTGGRQQPRCRRIRCAGDPRPGSWPDDHQQLPRPLGS